MNKKLILKKLENKENNKRLISSYGFLKRFILYPRMFFQTINCFILRKLNFNKFIITNTFWDRKMLVVLPEVVSSDIHRFGFIESNVARSIIKFVSKNDVVIDIGAHFGFFTLLMADLVGPYGQVHSFEPIPSTYKVLKKNVSNLENIQLNRKAIWRFNEQLYLNDYGLNSSAFNSYREPRGITKINVNRVKVNAIKLDDYIKNKRINPKFIKIDAESTEFEVLLGMDFILKYLKPVICLEIGDLGVTGAKKSKNVIEHILNYGYEVFEYKDSLLSRHELQDTYIYGNLIFQYFYN